MEEAAPAEKTRRPFDERTAAPDVYDRLLHSLRVIGPRQAARRVQATLESAGCTFDGVPFVVDPVPRVLSAREWAPVAAGLEQRVRALEAFAHDVYGEQRAVREGVVPERVVSGAAGFDRRAAELPRPRVRIAVAGVDLVRAPSGEFRVLEDNVRTPSGLAYMAAARRAIAGLQLGSERAADIDKELIGALRRVLAGGAVLSDGERNSAFWEHRAVADAVGIPLVRAGELNLHGVRSVYRRTDDDTMLANDARLIDAVASGRTQCVNAFGNGVADDKLVHGYVEDLIRFFLGEEPRLRSVRTFDLQRPGMLDEALGRLEDLVLKPRAAHGGQGVMIGPRASAAERDRAAQAARATPHEWVAQETVPLSEHPTVVGDDLEPRHVDLRAFVVADGEQVAALPGGLTRFARAEGDMIVNSSRGGGAKDTWVL